MLCSTVLQAGGLRWTSVSYAGHSIESSANSVCAPPLDKSQRVAARWPAQGHDDHRALARQLIVAPPRLHPQHAPAGAQVLQPAPRRLWFQLHDSGEGHIAQQGTPP